MQTAPKIRARLGVGVLWMKHAGPRQLDRTDPAICGTRRDVPGAHPEAVLVDESDLIIREQHTKSFGGSLRRDRAFGQVATTWRLGDFHNTAARRRGSTLINRTLVVL